MTKKNPLAARLVAKYRGRREVGLDPGTIERRLRLGRTNVDARATSWPNAAADINPDAAALTRATRKALKGLG